MGHWNDAKTAEEKDRVKHDREVDGCEISKMYLDRK